MQNRRVSPRPRHHTTMSEVGSSFWAAMGCLLCSLPFAISQVDQGGVGGYLGTPWGAPRLMGASMVEYNKELYIFGGIAQNDTAPTNKIFIFSLVTREWQELTPAGEERPLGRMFHSAYIKNSEVTGLPEAMIVYGGINCFQRVEISSQEKAVAYYTWSNNAIEYQFAMEDIWFFSFESRYWIEMKPMRTKRRGVCPAAENVQAISGPGCGEAGNPGPCGRDPPTGGGANRREYLRQEYLTTLSPASRVALLWSLAPWLLALTSLHSLLFCAG